MSKAQALTQPIFKKAKSLAGEFVQFLNDSPTPFHATKQCCDLLKAAGFTQLKESATWSLQPNGKYFVTKNHSTVVAFSVGGKWKPGEGGFGVIAAHTDSPCFKLKPNTKQTTLGYLQTGVMCYGGAIWRTWFDRDLTIAGRVFIRGDKDSVTQRLLHVRRPILRIPSLAIHLDRDSNDKYVMNKETDLVPILATEVVNTLNSLGETEDSNKTGGDHHPVLLDLIANELNVSPEAVVDFELYVTDTQPACLGGIHEEFVYGPRLDNLASTYVTVKALIDSVGDSAALQNDSTVRMAVCFDHEEIGSGTTVGAESALMEWILRRICAGHATEKCAPTAFEQSIARSLIVSADQAHAVHPNFKLKHEENHRPTLHGGVVLKTNANQRYATNGYSQTVVKEVARIAGVPLQHFCIRNDAACGSTVGPIMAAKLGVQVVDLGMAQLAMHSAREMMGSLGLLHGYELFDAFFRNYSELSTKINAEDLD